MPRGGKRTRSGPPPTPTKLRELRGGRARKGEPKGEPGLPEPPLWLTPEAAEAWREVARYVGPEMLGVAERQDEKALGMLVDAWAEWRTCRNVCEAHGYTVTSEEVVGEDPQTGAPIVKRIIRARPEAKLGADAWRRCHAMLAEFGLTPSSRTKVKAAEASPEDPLEELQRRRGQATKGGRRGGAS